MGEDGYGAAEGLFIGLGETGYFSFTTPQCAVGRGNLNIGTAASAEDYVDYASTVGPVPKALPEVYVDVDFHASESGTQNGVTNGQLKFWRTGDVSKPLVIAYGVNDALSTATLNDDYEALPGCVVFEAGFSHVTVPLVPRADAILENPEEYMVVEVLPDGGSMPAYKLKYTPAETSDMSDVPGNYRAQTFVYDSGKPKVTLFSPSKIPVNADNDNGSKWQRQGIPGMRDFDARNLPKDDEELVAVQVDVSARFDGVLTVTAQNPGKGSVSLWKDLKKNAAFQPVRITNMTPVLSHTITLFVDGTHESLNAQDFCIITATFDPDLPGPNVAAEEKVLVTPVVHNAATVLPSPPNLIFTSGNSSGGGDFTGKLITFAADVTTGPNQSVAFVQNLTADINGVNGGGHAYEAVYGAGTRLFDLQPKSGEEFPFVDVGDDNAAGDITLHGQTLASPTADSAVYTAQDAPVFKPNTVTSYLLTSVDYISYFTTYLTVTYPDTSIYTVAVTEWSINFFAYNYVQGKGVTTIDPASKYYIESDWKRSNADVERTDGTSANKAVEFVEVT